MNRPNKRRGGLAPDQYLTEEQLKRLRRYVKDRADLARLKGGSRSIVDEIIVELMANTGLRASELIGIDLGDLPTVHEKDEIWIRNGKGNVTRTIVIPEKLIKRLERFVKLYRKGAAEDEALLVSERGNRMIYRSIYSKIRRLGKQVGLNKLHPHVLRHTYLTRLYNIEKDLRFVQDQAGHASPTTTAIYARTNNEARKRQVQALDDDF